MSWMPLPRWTRLTGAFLALMSTPGCLECANETRCVNGTQVEWCNSGSDGETHRSTRDCDAPNLACVQLEETKAQCVHAPATPCGADFVDFCDGTKRVYCDERLGFALAVDCTDLGSVGCQVDPAHGKAVCR